MFWLSEDFVSKNESRYTGFNTGHSYRIGNTDTGIGIIIMRCYENYEKLFLDPFKINESKNLNLIKIFNQIHIKIISEFIKILFWTRCCRSDFYEVINYFLSLLFNLHPYHLEKNINFYLQQNNFGLLRSIIFPNCSVSFFLEYK